MRCKIKYAGYTDAHREYVYKEWLKNGLEYQTSLQPTGGHIDQIGHIIAVAQDNSNINSLPHKQANTSKLKLNPENNNIG